MTKLLFIGFDGLDYNILKQYLKQNSDALLNKLDGSLLRMTPEDEGCKTGPSWTTIYTGLKKEHHGITGSWGNPSKFRSFIHPCIWDVLNNHDVTVGLFGLPVTYPPKAIVRFWISGFPTPLPKTKHHPNGAIISYPVSIQNTYLQNHIVDMMQVSLSDNKFEDLGHPEDAFPRNYMDEVLKLLRKDENYLIETLNKVYDNQRQTIERLYTHYPVDVAFIQHGFIDNIGHFWNQGNGWNNRFSLCKTVYPIFDRVLKDTYSFFKPDNLIVVSDHGFQKGVHTPHATAFFHGPNIIKDYGKPISNMDIMPTTLFMLDLPPIKMDGKVKYGLFKSQYLTNAQQETIKNKLKALGYI